MPKLLLWGQGVDEYKEMFGFSPEEINTPILEYGCGPSAVNYINISDYHLPFADFSFDFALSAHYLFADLDEQTVEFHLAIIRELARVAKEVRIFPLIDRNGKTSEFLGPVLLGLQQDNYGVEIREVDFHLYPTGNAMLRVWAQQCEL